MQTIKHAVISAAGIGSRLELNMPKCLVEIKGRKLIEYILDLLVEVEDVRIVVGFMEEEVIKFAKEIRKDIVFVRNDNYLNTTNAYSAHLGSKGIINPYLIIDGDLIINPNSFQSFVKRCNNDSLVGITKKKSQEAVSVRLENDSKVVEFVNEPCDLDYEWSGIAYLKDVDIRPNGGYVFKELEKYLPLQSFKIDCHEIDTPEDLANAKDFCEEIYK